MVGSLGSNARGALIGTGSAPETGTMPIHWISGAAAILVFS
jgi:hypothetical protein